MSDLDEVIGAVRFDVVGDDVSLVRQSAAEAINNAMVKLEFLARLSPPVSAGVKKALAEMVAHWLKFFRSGDYWTTPETVLYPRLKAYAEWYARALALVPQDMRDQVPSPESVMPTFLGTLDDSLMRVVDANIAAAEGALEAARVVKGEFLGPLVQAALVGMTLYFGIQLLKSGRGYRHE